jgi:catalase
MPNSSWKEIVVPGENESFERVAALLRELQVGYAGGHPPARALHAKANAGLFAEVRVAADVPEPLRVGIFAKPATFKAYARYSNGSAKREHDKKGDVRALSVKILGVPGKKLIPGLEDKTTHDLLLVRTPTSPARTADEFGALVYAAQKPSALLFRLIRKVGFIRAFQIIKQAAPGARAPLMPLASTTYYSMLPLQWGAHAVKLSLSPHDPRPATLPPRTSPTALGDELTARLADRDVVYDLRAQMFVDETSTPIEDATVEWKESVAPPQKIAELVLPKQDCKSARGIEVAAFIETLSFDPWHAPVEFRPLGQLMRARNVAYRVSTMERKAAPEPDGSETFPD